MAANGSKAIFGIDEAARYYKKQKQLKNMHIKYYIPKGARTINTAFENSELESGGLIESNIEEASILISEKIEDLRIHIKNYGNEKKYLIWCDEPLWSTIFFKLPRALVNYDILKDELVDDGGDVKVHVMNCFTGDVLISNNHFLLNKYELNEYSIFNKKIESHYDKSSKIAALLTYRNNPMFEYKDDGKVFGLSNYRSSVVLNGYMKGIFDVYGHGWPEGISIANDRLIDGVYNEDFSTSKLNIIKKYKYSYAVENTWAPYYVTEKIWQSIAARTLPIYYAGNRHTIYSIFPKNSFIDLAFLEFGMLDEYLKSMSDEEYNRRLNLCENSLRYAARVSDFSRKDNHIRMMMLFDKINFIIG